MRSTFKPLAVLASSAAVAVAATGWAHAADAPQAPPHQQPPAATWTAPGQQPPFARPSLGTIAIGDARVREPRHGSRRLVLTVRRTPAAGSAASALGPATVRFASAARSAKPGSDYRSVRGALRFATGQTTGQIAVAVLADQRREGTEGFRVTLSEPSGALVTDADGWAIVTDEGCDCVEVDAALALPTAADLAVPRLWAPPPEGFKGFYLMVKTAITCTEGTGGCVGEVVLKGTPGVAQWSTTGPNNSEVVECSGPCGKTTEASSRMVRLDVPRSALASDEPYELKVELHARCPMSEAKVVTVTLNFLRGSFRPRFSDLDGDGKADRR